MKESMAEDLKALNLKSPAPIEARLKYLKLKRLKARASGNTL